MLWIARLDTTTSKEASAKGSALASPSHSRTRSVTPSSSTFLSVDAGLLFA
jgi:hypothetical protein